MGLIDKTYFDNASTTYVYPEVVDLISYTMKEMWGNPSNLHSAGMEARGLVEDARKSIAGCLDVDPKEIVFTSCASESNALAINQADCGIVSPYEHHDIKENSKITVLKENDIINLHTIAKNYNTIWAHLLVNNETGEVFDLRDGIKSAHEREFLTLVDGTQALGNIDVKPHELGTDFMSFSLHKVHAPKGIGILYNKDGRALKPLICGSQEMGYRGGTENVPYIVGGAYAMVLALQEMKEKNEHCKELRGIILHVLNDRGLDFIVNEGKNNIPSILNIAFKGITGDSLMLMLDNKGYCVSTGSACNSGDLKPSEVLSAMGVTDDYIQGAIRISTSLRNDRESAYGLAHAIGDCVLGVN